MKQRHLLSLLTMAVCLLMLTACGKNGRVPQDVSPKDDTTMASDLMSAEAASAVSTEDAKTIALEHAGLSAQDVDYIHAEVERDNGREEIHVEFRVGNTEYEYKIDPADGAILSYDKDADR